MARTRKEPDSINLGADDNIESFDIEGEEGEAVSDSEDPAPAKGRRKRASRRREPAQAADTAESPNKSDETENETTAETIEAADETTDVTNEEAAEMKTTTETDTEIEAQADSSETADTEEKTKRPRRGRSPKVTATEEVNSENKTESKTEGKDVPNTVEETLGTVIAQWNNIEELSKSMAGNFERVATMLQDLQNNHLALMQENAKPKYAKLTFLQKAAMGASAVAVVIAFVGLTLAQSARQSAVDAYALSKVPNGTFNISARAPRTDGTLAPSNARSGSYSDFTTAPRRDGSINLPRARKNRR